MFLSKRTFVAGLLMAPGMIATGAEPKDQLTGTTVTGRVIAEPGGKEVAGVTVTLWNGYGGINRTSQTDDAGSYSFSDVKPGEYYKVWIQERPKKESGVWSEAVVVRVADSPVRADDLFLKLPQSISGTVTDLDSGKPAPGVTINFSTAEKNRDSVRTDSDGHYCLFVTPREVDLQCQGTNERYYASDPRKKVTVLPGDRVKEINFNIQDAPKFSGTVVYPDGSPAKGLDILVRIHWSARQPVFSAADGVGYGTSFRLKTDEQGAFLGYARRQIQRDWEETVELKAIARLPNGTMGGVAHAKTNSKEYRIDPMKVVLAKSAGVKLRVVNQYGEPITNANVTASDIYPGLYKNIDGPLKHLGEGTYLMTELIPGLDYHLSIQATGYQQSSLDKEIVLKPDEIRDLGDVRLE